MKNLKYLFSISLVFAFILFSCEDNGEDFNPNPDSGWIQFQDGLVSSAVVIGESISVPFELNTISNSNGVTVSFALEDVTGSAAASLGVADVYLAQGELSGNAVVTVPSSIDIADISTVRLSISNTSNDALQIGLSDDSKPITYDFDILCTFNVSDSYDAFIVSEDLGITLEDQTYFGVDVSYSADLEAVPDTSNQWFISSLWGPNFVYALTGNPAFIGNPTFAAAGIIQVNSDASVQASGSVFDPGDVSGLGNYNSCTNVFVIDMVEDVFSNPFTFQLILQPAAE